MKKIIIETLVSSEKTAVIENDKLTELLIDEQEDNKLVSNIYRGIVKNVKAGLEACFIDIGIEKLGYLPIKKNSNIKSGMDIMVQVNKDAVGTKGPKLSLEISLSGRYLVYIPSNDRVTVSNRLQDENEKLRLKNIAEEIIGKDCGVIIRTEASGCSKEDLIKDFEQLKQKYELIEKEFKLGIGPKLLQKESDASIKYVKDNMNENISEIIVNDEARYEEIKEILKNIDKDYLQKLKLIENQDIFDIYKVQAQIQKSLNKKIWLKSGGYIIIEKTEALTVIDVNTGKFTGSSNREDTVYKTNKEACIEIARQLKLRDIGGIIIIDFIDMIKKQNQEDIIKKLQYSLSKDKRKSQVLGLTKLGLVEVARRREGNSIDEYYLREDNDYTVTQSSKSINYIIDEIEKEIKRIKIHTSYDTIQILLNSIIYKEIKDNHMEKINKITKKYIIDAHIVETKELTYENYKIIFVS